MDVTPPVVQIPSTVGPLPEAEAQIEVASQWQLMWWRFRQHRVAFFSAIVVLLIYVVALFPEFLAPFPADEQLGVLTLEVDDPGRSPWKVTVAFPQSVLVKLLGDGEPRDRRDREDRQRSAQTHRLDDDTATARR